MYLTSFIHRNALFDIAERWLCNRPQPCDCRSLTEILICDGFVIHETLTVLTKRLIEMTHHKPYQQLQIQTKGELRDIIYHHDCNASVRVAALLQRYQDNPDYYYREAPIYATVCLDDHNRLLASFRTKRPKRIAEKANRRIANWIFDEVTDQARKMARERAGQFGVPLDSLLTATAEMVGEFIQAEEIIAGRFRDGSIRFDKAAVTIQDVGAIKVVAEHEQLQQLTQELTNTPGITVIEREDFSGKYQATNLILEIPWDVSAICQKYRENADWERYRGRGLSEEDLKKGLEPFLADAERTLNIELILTTFPDLVESELGTSIHEERIISQRDNKRYHGYIPMNVEFIVEYLFAVGFSPSTDIDRVPIKLWGRYLPETLASYIRQLYNLPEHNLIQ